MTIASCRLQPINTQIATRHTNSNSIPVASATRAACDPLASEAHSTASRRSSLTNTKQAVEVIKMAAISAQPPQHRVFSLRFKCTMELLVGKRKTFLRRINSGARLRLRTNLRSSQQTRTICFSKAINPEPLRR